MRIETFINKAIPELIDNGISVKLINEPLCTLDDGFKTCGWFCEVEKELVVAVGRPKSQWQEVFLHEYCHFQQTQDPHAKYEDYPEDTWYNFDQWLNGNMKLSREKVKSHADMIRNNEMDCEKRVVRLIQEYSLPIDEKDYIRGANVYGMWYTAVQKYKKWYDATPPSEVRELREMMPTSFKRNWDKLPDKFDDIVLRHCFKKK